MLFTYPRSAWEDPSMTVTGPAFDVARLRNVTIHYTAADDLIDGDAGENWDNLPQYIRNMQSSYVHGRGYSLGYNCAVDQRGKSWEIRGLDFRCAANGAPEPPPTIPADTFLLQSNSESFAILVLVDGNDRATPNAAAEVRRIVDALQIRTGRTLNLGGHYQNKRTSCPGEGLKAQLAEGVFIPRRDPPPPPVPEEDDMKVSDMAVMWNHAKYGNVFLIAPGGAIHLSPALYKFYKEEGVKHLSDEHAQTLKSCLAQCGLTEKDLNPK